MQGVASLVAMPHKTTETRSSVGPASSTEVKVGTDKNSPSLPNLTEAKGAEGIAVCLLLFENSTVNQNIFIYFYSYSCSFSASLSFTRRRGLMQ